MKKNNLLKLSFICGLSLFSTTLFANETISEIYNKNGIIVKLKADEKGKFNVSVENKSKDDMLDVKIISDDIEGLKITNGKELLLGDIKAGEEKILDEKYLKFEIEKEIITSIHNQKLAKTSISGVYKLYIPLSIAGMTGMIYLLISKDKKSKKLLSLILSMGMLSSSFIGITNAEEIYRHKEKLQGKIIVDGKDYDYSGIMLWNDRTLDNSSEKPSDNDIEKPKDNEINNPIKDEEIKLTECLIEWENLAPPFKFVEGVTEVDWPKNQGMKLIVSDNLGNKSRELIYVTKDRKDDENKSYFSTKEQLVKLLKDIDFAFDSVELVDKNGKVSDEATHIKIVGPKIKDKKQIVTIQSSVFEENKLIEVIDYEFYDYGEGTEPAPNWYKEDIDGKYILSYLKIPVFEYEGGIDPAMTIDDYKIYYQAKTEESEGIWIAEKEDIKIADTSLQKVMDGILGENKSKVVIGPDSDDPESLSVEISIPMDMNRTSPLVIYTRDFGFHLIDKHSGKVTANEDSIKIFGDSNKFEFKVK